ncbi:MAG: VOC family protein [Treponema sp.]|nr:VOC family protein [Treponema sp.]
MAGIVEENVITQVGIIVRDIERSKEKWAAFLGVPVPPTISAGEYSVTKTRFRGEEAPDATCLMAFFSGGPHLQVELIQPNGAPSTWQEFLDQKGEGIHHIAFRTQGMDKAVAAFEAAGMELVQRGLYGDASGEYAYMDATEDLKCIVELLESYKR